MENKEEKDIYIEVINFGKERLRKKIKTRNIDLDEHLKSIGFDVPNGNFLDTIFLDVFGTLHMRDNHLPSQPAYLNSDSYFKLLDYEELKQARKSSKEAKTMAFWAICISGVLALFSILLNIYQIVNN